MGYAIIKLVKKISAEVKLIKEDARILRFTKPTVLPPVRQCSRLLLQQIAHRLIILAKQRMASKIPPTEKDVQGRLFQFGGAGGI